MLRFLFGFVVLLALGIEARPRFAGAGYADFKKAFSFEKEKQLEAAIRHYRVSIRKGIKPELNKAARWRLHYIYRESGFFLNARAVLPYLPSRERNQFLGQLEREHQQSCTIPIKSIQSLYRNMVFNRYRNSRQTWQKFKKTLIPYADKQCLKKDVLRYLTDQKMFKQALALSDVFSPNSRSAMLYKAHYYTKMGQLDQSEPLLLVLTQNKNCLDSILPFNYETRDTIKAGAWAELGRLELVKNRRNHAVTHFTRAWQLAKKPDLALHYCTLASWHAWKSHKGETVSCLQEFTRAELSENCNAMAVYWLQTTKSDHKSSVNSIDIHHLHQILPQCTQNIRKEIQLRR